jgi:hypothetical protein
MANNSVPTGKPTISGSPTQGQILRIDTVGIADVDGLGTFSYQWSENNSAIAGATSNTFALTEAQVGKAITVAALYTDGLGTIETVASAATNAVVNVNDAPLGMTIMSGSLMQGETLTATVNMSEWSNWQFVSYVLVVSHGGSFQSAYGSNTGYPDLNDPAVIFWTNALSNGLATRAEVFREITNGVSSFYKNLIKDFSWFETNFTLTDPDGIGTLSYQWLVDGKAIAGATSAKFSLTEQQVGKLVSVVVSYTDGHGTRESVSTVARAVANLNDPSVGTVSIAGTPTIGQTLTVSHTLSDADGLGVISYQWKANGTVIVGATGALLKMTDAYLGKPISVTAAYTDGHGLVEAVSSIPTDLVGYPNTAPTGAVVISGTTTQGQVLSASNTIADADGLGAITYQWKADGALIVGATSSTFTLGSATFVL